VRAKARTKRPVLILSRVLFEVGHFTCLGCWRETSRGFRVLVADREMLVCDSCKRKLERRP
jgi:hypothetical protein